MKNIAFIDFEMNSNGDMDKKDLEIIEFAIVICNKNGKEINKKSFFVKPFNKICDFTTFLTGITQEDMKKAITFKQMIKKINSLVKTCDYIYCWGDTDKYCLKINSNKYDINNNIFFNIYNKIVDLQKNINHKLKINKNISLLEAANKFNIEEKENSHRALPDALLLKKIYFKSLL